jgi:hypothetical protein
MQEELWKAFSERLQQPHSDWALQIRLWMMYCFKVMPCPREGRHDWATCCFKHRKENAGRRDLRVHAYSAVDCAQYKCAPQLCLPA